MDRSLESPWAWQYTKSLMSKLLDDFAHYHPLLRRQRSSASPLCGPMLSTSSISTVALTGIHHPLEKKSSGKKILRKSSTENKIEKETKAPHLTVSYHTPSVAKFFHPFFCDKGAFFSDALFWGLLADLLVEDFKIIWEYSLPWALRLGSAQACWRVHKEFCRLTATKPERVKTMHTLFYPLINRERSNINKAFLSKRTASKADHVACPSDPKIATIVS